MLVGRRTVLLRSSRTVPPGIVRRSLCDSGRGGRSGLILRGGDGSSSGGSSSGGSSSGGSSGGGGISSGAGGRAAAGGGAAGGGAGGTGSGNAHNCPRCAVPLTKFWLQDSPLWGCVDCREIYPATSASSAADRVAPSSNRLPRSWVGNSVMAGALLGQLGPQDVSGATSAASSIATAPPKRQGTGFSPSNLPPPEEFKVALDAYVVGQEDTKRVLAVAVHNHYKRLRMNTPADGQHAAATPSTAGAAADEVSAGGQEEQVGKAVAVSATKAPQVKMGAESHFRAFEDLAAIGRAADEPLEIVCSVCMCVSMCVSMCVCMCVCMCASMCEPPPDPHADLRLTPRL